MRKSKLLAGQYGVYVGFDKISKHYTSIYFASNDEDFIRLHLPTLIINTPLRDLQIFKIGIFNDVTGEIKQTAKKRVPTDCYLFPHSRLSPPGEDLTPEDIENAVTETKNIIISDNQLDTDKNIKEENNE